MGRARRHLLAVLSLVLLGSAPSGPARADDAPRCNRWNMEVSCATSYATVVVGDEFTATVTAKNIGDTVLENVTLRLRGDQGAPCVAGPGTLLTRLVARLEPGQSEVLTARFLTESIGTARVLGSAKDSFGWASGNCACTVAVVGLPALQSSMTDKDVAGEEKGIFDLGEAYDYVLFVENDLGSEVTPDLKVVFQLPDELEFVSGKADGKITVTGKGHGAETSTFVLAPPSEKVRIEIRVKATKIPASQLVKVLAVIQTPGGISLAQQSESTTIKQQPK